MTQDSNHKLEDNPGIKLYKIELLKFQNLVPELFRFLSDSECSRANRYHFIKDKNRFIICRSLLRFLLAEHVDLDIGDVILEVDFNKKPYLSTHPSVYFNVTHAGDYALIAIGKSPLGVDIEYINKAFDYKDILPNIFNQNEKDAIELNVDNHLTFYKFWTRKEAIVKAIGKGIDDNISKIPVTDGFHSLPSSLVWEYKHITVLSLNINNHYVGALAITEDLNTFEKIVFYPVPTEQKLKSLFI